MLHGLCRDENDKANHQKNANTATRQGRHVFCDEWIPATCFGAEASLGRMQDVG